MPNLDGTGPAGRGPQTGRRRGRCSDNKKNITELSTDKNSNKDETLSGFGRGRGRRRGQSNSNRGRGKSFGRN